ncbi:heme exporter protein CcmD [Ramlibacter alkalitolerans]|jgi:heme exporter protein D|uniref:Heme exporter protein D n=1 Tax=Ramlibacter alkalitolerans TaxID=2039631 RepID=A0ABS1JIX3_9BURK|nr:heme exporter protein CcmD [Ramlibacter alkalitolerans]MBL0424183.1 heme exporter protein CcmD [Ramlibacter alkalitolerans]
MIWNSMSDFWHMGGYGLYVWGSVGVCAVALVWEQVALKKRTEAILRSLRRRARAEKMDRELA